MLYCTESKYTVWIRSWFTCMHVGLKCRVRYHIADLIHLLSVPQLINLSVDNFVYNMTPSSLQMLLFYLVIIMPSVLKSPLWCWCLRICIAYADRGLLFLLERTHSWYLNFKFLPFCPTYVLMQLRQHIVNTALKIFSSLFSC